MRNFHILILSIILTFNTAYCQGENIENLNQAEDQLVILLNNLRKAKNDSEKDFHNIALYEELRHVLILPGVLVYPFSKLSTMSTVQSPDGMFRLFNWNVESDQLFHTHYCILVKKGKIGKNRIIEFHEDKFTIPPSPSTMLTPNRWYGALYYKIIPIKKGGKTLYTILGFNGNSRSSNKKVIDVFWFRGNSLKLGYPIFEESESSTELKRRVFFEYSEKATVSVKFLPEIGKIVFNHLSPEAENLKGMYEFYVPDLTYDAYYLKNGIWKYQKDIQVGNLVSNKTKIYNPNPNGKNDKFTIVKSRWEDPSGESGVHVAVEVENDGKNHKSKSRKKTVDKQEKKRRFFKRKTTPHSAIEID